VRVWTLLMLSCVHLSIPACSGRETTADLVQAAQRGGSVNTRHRFSQGRLQLISTSLGATPESLLTSGSMMRLPWLSDRSSSG
jgi:hypothetical protein